MFPLSNFRFSFFSPPAFSVRRRRRRAEPETLAYVAAVEAADGQPLALPVQQAIDTLIRGCKRDGTWDAIKACCLLAGPATLDGALTPLKGAAPTNHNFLDADYDPVEGLTGDGTTKYLNSNRANDDDPQDNQSVWVWVAAPGTADVVRSYWGANRGGTGATDMAVATNGVIFSRSHCADDATVAAAPHAGFVGLSRSAGDRYIFRRRRENSSLLRASETPSSGSILILARSDSDGATIINYTDATIAAYGIGEAVDLAALDARLTDYMHAIAAALP